MHHLLVFSFAVASFVLMTLPAADASTSCYHCVTTKTWKKESCPKSSIQSGCSFCTKASFGNALFVRACVKAGTTNMFTDPKKMCKSYKDFFLGSRPTAAMKKKWVENARYYGASCTALKNKEPFKGNTCTKKSCNAAPKPQSLASSLIIGLVGVYCAKSIFRWQF